MKYVPPAGAAEGAAYIDGNRSAGIKGSIVPAKAIEFPQREIDHVITFFGLTPTNTDTQQLRKAIEAGIAAATGGGDTSQFLLVSQARARLPIFPEILSADGRMIVTSPAAGTVQVPSAVSFQHRGIYPVSTSDYIEDDRTFETLANKTYHLRWNPDDGFLLEDLADAGYNPTALPETNTAFDSTYDDMLVSRVVTSAGNVATITNLANKPSLTLSEIQACVPVSNINENGSNFDYSQPINWGRTPTTHTLVPVRIETGNTAVVAPETDYNIRPPGASLLDLSTMSAALQMTRYGIAQRIGWDFASALEMHFSARA